MLQSLFIERYKLFQADAVLHDIFGGLLAHIAEVPGLIHDARDVLLAFGIAEDEPVRRKTGMDCRPYLRIQYKILVLSAVFSASIIWDNDRRGKRYEAQGNMFTFCDMVVTNTGV